MNARPPIEMIPVPYNGMIVWMKGSRALGDASAVPEAGSASASAGKSTAGAGVAAATVINTFKSTSGATVTTTGKVAGVVGAVGMVVVYINPIIGGIIIGAAALVGAIWGTSKDKTRRIVLKQYESVNGQLQSQIYQIDAATRKVTSQLDNLNTMLRQFKVPEVNISSLQNLGTASSTTTHILDNAKETNDVLTKALDTKMTYLQNILKLIGVAENKLAVTIGLKKDTATIVLWALGGLAAMGFLYYGYQQANEKSS